MRVQAGGKGEPTLLLVHGLGATGDVWNGWHRLLQQRWPGRWLAPDLPGHGGSPPLPEYTFATFADGIAPLLDEETVVLGHSLGGAVGLVLAAHHAQVRIVVGLGIKVAWTAEELDRARVMAYRPVTWFGTRDEAVARYLRVSGLTDPDEVGTGIRQQDGQWRLAMDPRTFGVGAPDMTALLAACPAPFKLARGELDHMVSDDQLDRLGRPRITLAGLGHNAHVERPEAVLELVLGP